MKKLWMSGACAIALVAGSGFGYAAGVDYLPSLFMFGATLIVMGVLMTAEDGLLRKYDTPHEEDRHPPPLIMLRVVRSTLLAAMIVVTVIMLL